MRLMPPSLSSLLACLLFCQSALAAEAPLPEGWQPAAPRDEIRPALSYDPQGGPQKTGAFVIAQDERPGLDGWFQKSFPVQGGAFYRFTALRRTTDVMIPRHSGLARVAWQNDAGKIVSSHPSTAPDANLFPVPSAEPEHPVDGATDAAGWTTVSGVYQAPPKATRALIELHLQHAPRGRAEWSEISFAKTEVPASRKIRLATVHYRPQGHSPKANREEFAPLLADAAAKRADLVVLGETIPSAVTKLPPTETAEPIPGPTTEYFGQLAAQHRLHVVLSLYERDGHLIYNTGVLIGPEGQLIGKYRKVCLPHGEVAKGIAPGHDYPVFDTALGRIGIMVCYDGFFPEVARELTARGAEVIAWPVWGCNTLLARARACENHVYLISSSFMEPGQNWMISAIFDHAGTPIAQAGEWGTVAVAEVDLSRPYIGPYNLGDFRSMVSRHRPEPAGKK